MLVVTAARWTWPRRFGGYGLALLIANASELLLILLLGAERPWREQPSWLAKDLLWLAGLELVVSPARLSFKGGWRTAGVAMTALALLAVPGPLRWYETRFVGTDPNGHLRPALAVLTGLPLLWGEGGIDGLLACSGKVGAARVVLNEAFAVRAIDRATAVTLSPFRLLLLAQPRPPGPAGLVAIDDWVRRGGRVLVLTDPDLRWPSAYGLGDPRRPPRDDGLAPLLAHWGLELDVAAAGLVERDARLGRRYRLRLAWPGRFRAVGRACRLDPAGLVARCRIGRGAVALIADADLLHDLLWRGPDPAGYGRDRRTADNAALVVDLLDTLSGRAPTSELVDGGDGSNGLSTAIVAALVPPGLVLAAGMVALLPRRRKIRTDLSTDEETRQS